MSGGSHLLGCYPASRVTFVKGRGCELWDSEGRRYIDFLAGLAVVSLGHANPEIAEAMAEQALRLVHVSNLFRNEPAEAVAAELDDLLGGGGRVFFCNSGAEAVEAAVKFARRWGGGRRTIVAAEGSFHGRTLGALAATGQPSKREAFEPVAGGFRHVPFGDAVALEEALDDDVVAVLLEPILGEGGVVVPPAGYLRRVRELCDSKGVLLAVDEIQTGLGRTGTWFAHQHEGIRPDLVCIAKALGNGFPVGACWVTTRVADAIRVGDHGSTFGGQPLAMAVARAVLRELKRVDAPARAQSSGARLAEMVSKIPQVEQVRGRGLLLAAEFGRPIASDVAERAIENGVVVNAVTESAIRLAPPLVITDEEITEGTERLAAAIEEVCG
ncbi:MAG: acetylornithine aminotransferase [Acidimicrobiales bacterium]|nr:MAG: acetylornithine aminotransferase [Acidimicrobiales bacterium]